MTPSARSSPSPSPSPSEKEKPFKKSFVGPDMVCVFPEPVWPYASKHTLYPSATQRMSDPHSAYTSAWLASGPNARSNEKLRRKSRASSPRRSRLVTTICLYAPSASVVATTAGVSFFVSPNVSRVSMPGTNGRTRQNTRTDPLSS